MGVNAVDSIVTAKVIPEIEFNRLARENISSENGDKIQKAFYVVKPVFVKTSRSPSVDCEKDSSMRQRI